MTVSEHKLCQAVLKLEKAVNSSDLDDDLQPELALLRLETKQLLERILETIAISQQRRTEEDNPNV